MTMNYDNVGERVDLKLQRGSTFDRETMTFRSMLGDEARDLRDATVVARITSGQFSDTVIETFEYVAIDAENGHFELVLEADQIAAIPRRIYAWDCKAEYPDGVVRHLCWGTLTLAP